MPTPLPFHRSPSWLALLVGVLPVLTATAQSEKTSVSPSVAAPAPDAGLDYRQFDKVEITGSSIIRKQQTTALPVQVITRDDIRRSGANSMADVLQNLPIMSMVVTSAAMSTTIGGYTTASLRGLPAGTLLLLNGQRLASYGRQSVAGADRPGVDIHTIPLSAVDRIEILSDGASSLYGSDAIAGVINIITRSAQKGVEIAVEKMATSQGGGAGQQVSLNAGVGHLQNVGYSLRLTLEASHRDALQASKRPQYSQGRYDVQREGQTFALLGPMLTSFTTPGVFSLPAAPGQAAQFYSPLYAQGTCPPSFLPLLWQPSCQYNAYAGMTIYPEQDSQKLFLSGERILGAGATAYAEFLHAALKDSAFSGHAWPARTFKLGNTPTSVGVPEALAAGLDPAKVAFLWSPSGVQGLQRAYEQRNWRVSTGLKGVWQAWDYNAYVVKAQATVDRRAVLPDYNRFGWTQGATLTDPNMLQAMTPHNPLTAQVNSLSPMWADWDSGRTQSTAVHLRVSRPVFEIDGQDVMLGAGGEWRHESTDYRYIGFSASQPSFQAERTIQAAYLEVLAPLTPQWDLTASTRADRYSDVGLTHNSKLSSRFDLQNGWSARGSWGTGFRAPSLAQMQELERTFQIGTTAYLNGCSADMLATAVRLSQSGATPTACTSVRGIEIYGNGNPNLKPELSTQKSLGLAFRPTRNVSITADWWSIEMNDLISVFSDGLAYADPLRYPQYWMRSNSTLNKGALAMKLPLYNIGRRQKTGIDIDVRWRTPTDMGQWNVFAQATYNLRSEDQVAPYQPMVSDLARYNNLTDSITPRLRMRWMAGLTTPKWSLHGVLNHTSGYAEQDQTGVYTVTGEKRKLSGFKVPSFSTWDVNATYLLHPALSLRLTVGNVFNRQAPLSFTNTGGQVFGFNTRDHNLWGRTLNVSLVGKF